MGQIHIDLIGLLLSPYPIVTPTYPGGGISPHPISQNIISITPFRLDRGGCSWNPSPYSNSTWLCLTLTSYPTALNLNWLYPSHWMDRCSWPPRSIAKHSCSALLRQRIAYWCSYRLRWRTNPARLRSSIDQLWCSTSSRPPRCRILLISLVPSFHSGLACWGWWRGSWKNWRCLLLSFRCEYFQSHQLQPPSCSKGQWQYCPGTMSHGRSLCFDGLCLIYSNWTIGRDSQLWWISWLHVVYIGASIFSNRCSNSGVSSHIAMGESVASRRSLAPAPRWISYPDD